MPEMNQEGQVQTQMIPENPENQTQENAPINPDGELDFTMSDDEVQKLVEQSKQIVEGQEPQTQQEQLLAGKFKSEEELQKGLLNLIQKLTGTDNLEVVYTELEKVLGRGGLENMENVENESEESQEISNESLDELLDVYLNQYLETGEVPKELLEQTNASPELLELALKAKIQEQEAYVKQVTDYAGGEEEYQKLLTWVERNLSQEEQVAYAAAIQTMDPALVALVIDGVKARMTQVNPQLLEGTQTANVSSGDIYKSLDEALEAISDPRYGIDDRYTKTVQAKLIRSGFSSEELF